MATSTGATQTPEGIAAIEYKLGKKEGFINGLLIGTIIGGILAGGIISKFLK